MSLSGFLTDAAKPHTRVPITFTTSHDHFVMAEGHPVPVAVITYIAGAIRIPHVKARIVMVDGGNGVGIKRQSAFFIFIGEIRGCDPATQSEELNDNVSVHVSMVRAVRELRTIILSGWKSYELDAAVDMMEGKEPFASIRV